MCSRRSIVFRLRQVEAQEITISETGFSAYCLCALTPLDLRHFALSRRMRMASWSPLSRIFLGLGVGFILVGLALYFKPQFPFGFIGKIPGDFSFTRGNMRIYLPIGTCVVASVVFSAIVWLIRKIT